MVDTFWSIIICYKKYYKQVYFKYKIVTIVN